MILVRPALWSKSIYSREHDQAIVFHGDAEFGSVKLMRYLTDVRSWDFILGQRNSDYFHMGDHNWQRTGHLNVTKKRPFFASNVTWSKSHQFENVNFFAFYKPYQNGKTEPKKEVRYFTTSLPITFPLRRIGRRRWGCEPMFRDFKSCWVANHQMWLAN